MDYILPLPSETSKDLGKNVYYHLVKCCRFLKLFFGIEKATIKRALDLTFSKFSSDFSCQSWQWDSATLLRSDEASTWKRANEKTTKAEKIIFQFILKKKTRFLETS